MAARVSGESNVGASAWSPVTTVTGVTSIFLGGVAPSISPPLSYTHVDRVVTVVTPRQVSETMDPFMSPLMAPPRLRLR